MAQIKDEYIPKPAVQPTGREAAQQAATAKAEIFANPKPPPVVKPSRESAQAAAQLKAETQAATTPGRQAAQQAALQKAQINAAPNSVKPVTLTGREQAQQAATAKAEDQAAIPSAPTPSKFQTFIASLNAPNTPVVPGSSRDIYNKEQEAKAERAKDLADKHAEQAASGTAPQVAAPVSPAAPAPVVPAVPGGGSTTNALPQMTNYDANVQAALGNGNPAEAMKLAQAAAAQTAQMQSDAAIRQAVKGAKTSGAMGGQAALMGTSAGADAYGQGMTQGTQQYFDTTKLGASLGSEMSQRLARGESLSAQERMAAAQLKQSKAQGDAAVTQGYINSGIGLIGGIAGLFSDENLKEEIKPKDITRGLDKITGFAYKYKGQPRQEAGIMAQDLEKTAMAPAVIDTPQGKMVETKRLSTMNTAALAEHEKRLKDIERLVKGMGEIQKPKGKA